MLIPVMRTWRPVAGMPLNAPECTPVACPARCHLVPGDDLIGNLHLTIGEGGQHREDALPELLTTERAAGGVVTREVTGEELVDGVDISALHDLVERSLHECPLVSFMELLLFVHS